MGSSSSDTPHYEKVPEGWCISTIGEVFNLQAGKNISANDIHECSQNFPYACYGGNGIRGYVNDYNRDGKFPIIGRQGALCGNVNFAEGKFYATEHAVVVTCFAGVNIEWARYILEAMNLNQYATATAQPGLSVATVNEVEFMLPPLNEQCRIADFIANCFEAIESLTTQANDLRLTLDKAKSKILDLAIHGKLVPQDPNDEPASELLKRINPKAVASCDNPHYENVPFEIPENWLWVQLGDVTNYGKCSTCSVDDIHKESWILELEDIEKDTGRVLVRHSKAERVIKSVRHSFYAGNILYSKLRTYLNKVLVAKEDGFCTTEIIPIECCDSVHPDYICNILRSRYFLDYTAQCGYGVKMPRLSTTDARKALIPLPPYKEQIRISEKIDVLMGSLNSIAETLV